MPYSESPEAFEEMREAMGESEGVEAKWEQGITEWLGMRLRIEIPKKVMEKRRER